MSLISKIKSAYKKVTSKASSAYNKVKDTVTSVLSDTRSQRASSINALDFNNSLNKALQNTRKNEPDYGTDAYNNTNEKYLTAIGANSPGALQSQTISSGGRVGGTTGSGTAPVVTTPKTISAGKQNVGGGSNQVNNNLSAAYQAPTTLTSTALRTSSGTGTSPSSGGSTSVVTLPSSPGSTNPQVDNTQLAGSTAGLYERQPDGTFKLVEQKEQTVEDKVKDRAKLMEDYLGVKESVYDDREVKRAQKERQRIQQAIQAPMAELNAVVAKQNTDLLAHRKMVSDNGGTETGFGGIESAINYNAAIRALPLKASIASLQGELELAQDYLQELVTVKTDQINRQYEYRKQVFSSIEGILDAEDKRAYDKITKENDRAYAEEQDLIKTQFALSQMVMQNAPESVRTNVINRINAAPTKQAALEAAGQYGTDMLGRSIQQQQYNNAVLQGNKLKSEIESNQPVTGEYASVINGALGLVAGTKKQTVKNNIANALSNKQFDVAYAEIANAVSDGITGTNKTKFDDARTDMGILSGMRNAIQEYADGGGDMGLLTGKAEDIKKKLGIDSGKASVLATQLWREFQTYRSNMTGAAFSPEESRDYASVNPTLGKSLNLNLSVIDGALNQLENRVVSTVNARIPGAQKIYEMANGTNQTSQTNVDYTATLDSIFQ